jgi:hypothetical protein
VEIFRYHVGRIRTFQCGEKLQGERILLFRSEDSPQPAAESLNRCLPVILLPLKFYGHSLADLI